MAIKENLTSVDFDKMLLKSVEDAWFYDLENKSTIVAMLDEIKSGEFSGEESENEVQGKNGTTIAIFKNNKKFNVKLENAYVTATGLAMQNGATIEEGSSSKKIEVEREEVVTCDTAGELTVTDAPKTDATPIIYLANDDGSCKGTAITGGTVSGKIISAVSVEKDKKYVVVYTAEAEVGKLIVNDANSFAGNVRAVINVIGEDVCTGKEYLVQVTIPKLAIKGNYTLSLGDNPATMTVEGTAMKSVCDGGKLCTFAIL